MIQPRPEVLIIGSGPAGIASALALRRRNLPYRLVEKTTRLADTWASLYPSLRLNTSRFYSHLEGHRFPLHYGIFASGKQYHEYLVRVVEREGLAVEFNREVRRVSAQDGLWRVDFADGAVEHHRAVISATGIYGRPTWPNIPDMDVFMGQVIHAHDYKHPDQLRGRRVLVVGTGPSGVDIAIAASQVADQTAISMRSGVDLKRRYPLGLPIHAWLMLGLLLPRPVCRRLMRAVGQMGYPQQERYGLRKPQGGGLTAYQGPELLRAVQRGLIQPVPGPTRFSPHGVILADGSCYPADLVVLATGYEPVLHDYLDVPMQFSDEAWRSPNPCDWEIGPNGQRGFPLLDRAQHPNGRQILGQHGLYVVGVYYKGKGALYNINVEARIAAEQIAAWWAQP
ncbi:MAG: NAD(P)/FAD-dependent oxidoreductase [Anaerolineae bacterium]|nr:NAD(P)/FAD-dependent oxidoreductase [Anaerolineae bacterium]MDW8172922.1 NAD(P)/FAD-dependent oxidoreductase [Anaerolineae bacterium]